ncbi:FkbM family methyltransferase [Neorhodopirellula pilleata]|uniref:Methyltransferase FkbM domain-containing protein n=1 Tax=Neorhodopirellula pilleata TaxID=2714738 RepID=A0A5C6A6L8_9BACT|nr:FkbM family methyltransferase [Neorhodopirellula pilleata]TWT95622.1 hypothetical protein Pla100_32630 [Neorhodopirellula pilleata]
MLSILDFVRSNWRKANSLGLAFRSKLVAMTVGRRPSKSCQVKQLDQIIGSRFDLKRPGHFVEVGAYDGERFSNTSWLADNGWRGVYVEPSRQFSQLCRLRHLFNDTQVLNLAAGEEEGEVMLMQSEALSTMCEGTFDEYGRIPWAKKQLKKQLKHQATRVCRLDSLLQETKTPVGFELLVVDVEGYEENVFKGFELSHWKPKMLIVELCDVHPDFADNEQLVDSATRVRHSILEAGYTEIYRDEINSIFELKSSSDSCTPDNHRLAAA